MTAQATSTDRADLDQRLRAIAKEHALEIVICLEHGKWAVDVRGRDANDDLREVDYSGSPGETHDAAIHNALTRFYAKMFPGTGTT